MKYIAVILISMMVVGSLCAQTENDLFETAPWSATFGLGYITFEGDEVVKNAFFPNFKLGYDFSPRWTIEGDLSLFPSLEARTFDDDRFALDDDTSAIRIGADILFHLRNIRNMRWDPFITAGAGLMSYGDDTGDGSTDEILTAGAGMLYHFNDEWAVRGDVKTVLAGADTEANLLFTLGVNWRWGARVPAKYTVTGGLLDSDGDGLLDDDESLYGTDPLNPDTDEDGLSDGEEVLTHKTDPLNPDSDYDMLTDGAEVLTYSTDPMDADTDDGGVSDGHEVIEDYTDPLDGTDDLQLFTLNIEFAYDKADIRPQYYDDLDKIIKVLQRYPEATAKVEGHADKRPKSDSEYNQKLSERRAKAVVQYISDAGSIVMDRLSFVGHGFERPLVPNDSEENMQKNRRTEVYIRNAGTE